MSRRPLASLNATRRRAVELRRQGRTLASVAQATGLSVPTIIAACKAYETGGWSAVDVGRRGRRSGSGRSIPVESDATIRRDFLRAAVETETQEGRLWDYGRLCRWLGEAHDLKLTPRTAARHAARWGLAMKDLQDVWRAAGSAAASEWGEAVFAPVLARVRRERAELLWGAVGDIGDAHVMLYVHDRRGKMRWMVAPGPLRTPIIKEFLAQLCDVAGRKIHLLWHGAALSVVPELRVWLSEHRDRIEMHELPAGWTNPGTPVKPAGHVGAAPQTKSETVTRTPMTLTHLQRLEAESIHIMREVVAEADNPVMLYSIGKDSAVMLHLAMKAFYPAKPPFPLLHVDTQWKFKDMYAFRDKMVASLGVDLLVHVNPEGVEKGINPFTHGSAIHTDIMKTEGLKQALDKYGFDAAFGGARRDEEKSRAKERIFSFRSAQHRWDPKAQRPELWKLYNARKHKGESMRVFPLSNWTELDIWQYIYLEGIPIVPLYYSAERPVVMRDGTLIMVDDERMPLKPGEVPMMKKVRFRTLGCYPLTGAVESEADTLPAIIQEMLLTKTSERQGRVIDHDSAASMEKKKQEGYF
jgi:sulfate adenylyltransferase subunit 2